jgi:hypothetical protein
MLCWRASPNRAAVGEKYIDVAKAVLLTVLASCGWTHVAQVVLDDFCGVNRIDADEG